MHPLLARFHSKRLRTSAAIASIEHVNAVIGFIEGRLGGDPVDVGTLVYLQEDYSVVES